MNYSFSNWFNKRITEDFEKSFGVKNKWVTIDSTNIEKDPDLAYEIFDLINSAYKSIGGHADFKSAKDVINAFKNGEVSVAKAIDVDAVPDMDAVTIYKQRSGGSKSVASAAKSSSDIAKNNLIAHKAYELKQPGHYAEVSDKLAKILLSMGVPVVENPDIVNSIINKEVKWYGNHPDLSKLPPKVAEVFDKYKGWYGRVLGDGQIHAKIMVGLPKLKQ